MFCHATLPSNRALKIGATSVIALPATALVAVISLPTRAAEPPIKIGLGVSLTGPTNAVRVSARWLCRASRAKFVVCLLRHDAREGTDLLSSLTRNIAERYL